MKKFVWNKNNEGAHLEKISRTLPHPYEIPLRGTIYTRICIHIFTLIRCIDFNGTSAGLVFQKSIRNHRISLVPWYLYITYIHLSLLNFVCIIFVFLYTSDSFIDVFNLNNILLTIQVVTDTTNSLRC